MSTSSFYLIVINNIGFDASWDNLVCSVSLETVMTNYNFIGWDYPWFLSTHPIYAENKNPALLCNYVDEHRISVNL